MFTMRHHGDGFILLPVTLALIVIAAVALMLNISAPGELALSSAEADSDSARYAAEAGLQHGRWLLSQSACTQPADVGGGALNGANYAVTFTSDASGTVTTTTLPATADTYLAEDAPATNYGSDALLQAQAVTGSQRVATLRFDLSTIPTGTRVVSAALRLRVIDPDINVSQTLHRVTADWTEAGATWNDLATDFESTVQSTVPGTLTAAAYVDIDITELTQSWVNGTLPNYGVMIRPAPTSDVAQYASRDHGTTAHHPQLVVRTTSGAPATTAAINATATSALGATRTINRADLIPLRAPRRTVTVQPDAAAMADAWITAAKTDWNYGAHPWIRVNEGGGPQRGMLRFETGNLVPPGATVTRATLHLFADTLGGTLGVYGVTRGWLEGTCGGGCSGQFVSWATYDGTNNWTNPGADVDAVATVIKGPGASYAWHDFDITPLAAAWVSGARQNYGVQLRSVGGIGLFYSSDQGNPALAPKLTLEYTCACGEACVPPQGSGKLLLVVGDSSNPSAADQALLSRLTSWGYSVTLIGASAGQTGFDNAADANDVAYVSESVSASALGTKLRDTAIGVVLEKAALVDDFAIASGANNPVGSAINLTSTPHYISAPFAAGGLPVQNAATALLATSGTLAGGAVPLATVGGASALVTVDSGQPLTSGNPAAARRVVLQVGGNRDTNWAYANANGQLLASRALAWAGGNQTCTPQSLAVRISNGNDDAEEDRETDPGNMYLDSSDLELIDEANGDGHQLVGLRFPSLAIAPGATINDAWLDFTVDETDSVATALNIKVEASDNAAGFVDSDNNISSRTPTGTVIGWDPVPAWSTVGAVHTSPDIGALVQDVVDRPGWAAGNAMAFMISGTGERTAEAFEGDSAHAPLLRVNYCGDVVTSTELLMVVINPTSLTSQEATKKTLLESWGYTVNLIDVNDSQAAFDSAAAANALAFISEDIASGELGTKLTAAPIGVVTEEDNLTDEFGLSSTFNWASGATLNVVDNTHYITLPFGGGPVTIASTTISLAELGGTLAAGLARLANNSASPALVAVESGDTLVGGGSAAGRRVLLPWGGDAMDVATLSGDGLTLFRRALEWAAGATAGTVDGPVAHWTLNETSGTLAADSDSGHDGTLNGGAWASGILAGGLSLNGSSQYVSVPDDNALDLISGMTLMGWIYKNSLSGYDLVFNKGDAGNDWNYYLGTNGDELVFGFYNGGYVEFNTPSTNLTTGAWHHVAATFDNASDSVRLYVDGTEAYSGSTTATPLVNGGQLYIGRSQGGAWFDGKLDDLRILNYALSAADIASLAARHVTYHGFTESMDGGSTTQIVINKPAGTTTGDLLIAAVATDGNTSATLSAPAGWTLIDRSNQGGEVSLGVWWKIAGGSEPASFTFTWSGGEEVYGWIMRFSGAHPTSPVHIAASGGGNVSNPTSPAVVTSINNALILRLGGFDHNDINTDSPGLSGHTAITMDKSGNGGSASSGGAGYVEQSAPGDSGTSTFTLTGSEQYRAVTIGIAPQ